MLNELFSIGSKGTSMQNVPIAPTIQISLCAVYCNSAMFTLEIQSNTRSSDASINATSSDVALVKAVKRRPLWSCAQRQCASDGVGERVGMEGRDCNSGRERVVTGRARVLSGDRGSKRDILHCIQPESEDSEQLACIGWAADWPVSMRHEWEWTLAEHLRDC